MKKSFRHTGVLFMVAVIGLAVVGVGYALWFQVLTLNATVTTGELDVEWSNEANEPVYSVDLGQTFLQEGDPGFNPDKIVQTCEGEIVDDGHTLNITDTGLYPYAGCLHTIDIHNNGTIPVHINLDAIEVIPGIGNLDDLEASVLGCEFGNAGPNAEATVVATDPDTIIQLHPSNSIICDVIVYALQSAQENSEYTATVKVLAYQFNEEPPDLTQVAGRDNNETPLPTSTSTPEPTATATP